MSEIERLEKLMKFAETIDEHMKLMYGVLIDKSIKLDGSAVGVCVAIQDIEGKKYQVQIKLEGDVNAFLPSGQVADISGATFILHKN